MGGRKRGREDGVEGRMKKGEGEIDPESLVDEIGEIQIGELVCWTVLTFSPSFHQLHDLPRTEALHRGEEVQQS